MKATVLVGLAVAAGIGAVDPGAQDRAGGGAQRTGRSDLVEGPATKSAPTGAAEVPFGLPAEALAEAMAAPAELVALGERLFFDPVLSSDRSVSCASCHDPAHGFADPRPRSVGIGGRETLRHAPSLYNRALGTSFFWDGRAATLEEQVLMPIENDVEMGLGVPAAIERLGADASYARDFDAALGAPPDADGLARALSAFVRRQLHGDSRVDRFLAGDPSFLDASERAGLWLYESRGGCWRCHSGPNFADEAFHNTGVGAIDGEPEPGRLAITADDADRGAFKTPTLRGLTETAPYMHDGSLATLEDVVAFYDRGGRPNANLDAAMKPLGLSEEDRANLVAFLRALSER